MQTQEVGQAAIVPADAAAAIDSQELTGFHWKLLLVAGIGWLFDAMDVGLITFVLPALAIEWGLTPEIRGLILSAGFLGMFVGAAAAGTLADRFGRKLVFQSTLILYAVATGLSALVPDPSVIGLTGSVGLLLLLRFLVGLGLGGELPVASTLVTEWAPTKHRGRLLVLLESFWAYGWILAAIIGLLLIPGVENGWRYAFALGALPAIYALMIRRTLPESPRYLASLGDNSRAQEELARAGLAAGQAVAVPAAHQSSRGASAMESLRVIWSAALRRRTVMLWLLWFGMVFSYYGIFSWLPTLMTENRSLVTGFQYVLIITLAQVPGYFSAAWLVERWGRKPTLVTYLLGSAVGAVLYSMGGDAFWLVLFGSVISFFNLGAWGVIYTYTPELYPTRNRGAGAGWAAAIGRLGGVIGPYVPGLWLGAGIASGGLFVLFTAVLIFIAVVVLLLGEETSGRSLEEIAGS